MCGFISWHPPALQSWMEAPSSSRARTVRFSSGAAPVHHTIGILILQTSFVHIGSARNRPRTIGSPADRFSGPGAAGGLVFRLCGPPGSQFVEIPGRLDCFRFFFENFEFRFIITARRRGRAGGRDVLPTSDGAKGRRLALGCLTKGERRGAQPEPFERSRGLDRSSSDGRGRESPGGNRGRGGGAYARERSPVRVMLTCCARPNRQGVGCPRLVAWQEAALYRRTSGKGLLTPECSGVLLMEPRSATSNRT